MRRFLRLLRFQFPGKYRVGQLGGSRSSGPSSVRAHDTQPEVKALSNVFAQFQPRSANASHGPLEFSPVLERLSATFVFETSSGGRLRRRSGLSCSMLPRWLQ